MRFLKYPRLLWARISCYLGFTGRERLKRKTTPVKPLISLFFSCDKKPLIIWSNERFFSTTVISITKGCSVANLTNVETFLQVAELESLEWVLICSSWGSNLEPSWNNTT